jgi:hypothetical protein
VADQEQERQAAARQVLEDLLGPVAAAHLAVLADQAAGWADPVAALWAHPPAADQEAALSDLLAALARLHLAGLPERQDQEPDQAGE